MKGYWGRGSDFAEIKVDPKNADIVYCANIVIWKSQRMAAKHGRHSGVRPAGMIIIASGSIQTIRISFLIASDQGAIITVNGGETFSRWYNQPTAQFYHVSTDNAFPYNVYGGQQESGQCGIASRGNDGE